jgi:ketosteroid isomerase-like protein
MPAVLEGVRSADGTRSTAATRPAARALGLALLIGLVSFAHPAAAQFDGPDAEAVRAREIAFARTMADRDFEAFLTFVHPDAVFFNGNAPLRGRDAVAEAWRAYFDGPSAPFSWAPDLVQVLDGGGLALSSGPVLAPDGTAVGRFNSVWRRDADGEWRVVFDKGS